MRGQIVSVDNAAASNTATGAETTFSADVILASTNGIAPFQGKIWGWFLVPDAHGLRNPRLAHDPAVGDVGRRDRARRRVEPSRRLHRRQRYIPDVAEVHGGYRTAVPALIRKRRPGSVVIP